MGGVPCGDARSSPDAIERDRAEIDLHREAGPGDFVLPSGVLVPWKRAWAWACGEEPLIGIDRHGDWDQENRPPESRLPSVAALHELAASAREAGRALEGAARLLLQTAESNAEPAPDTRTASLVVQAERTRRG